MCELSNIRSVLRDKPDSSMTPIEEKSFPEIADSDVYTKPLCVDL